MVLINNNIAAKAQKPTLNLNSNFSVKLEIHNDIDKVKDVWQAFQAKAWHSPFQAYRWISAWHQERNTKQDYKVQIVFGYVDNELAFIMPLALQKIGTTQQIIWMATDVNDYNAPLVLSQYLEYFTTSIVKNIWDDVASKIPNADAFYFTKQPAFINKLENPFVLNAAKTASCSAHMLELEQNWESVYTKIRGAKSRKRIRQKTNKLMRAGTLEHKRVTDKSEIIVAVKTIIKWKQDQLNRTGARNPFNRNIIKNTILTNLNNDSLEQSEIQVFGLFLDDVLLAGLIAFVNDNNMAIFINAYNPDFMPNCSPGLILIVETMAYAANSGIKMFDFMAGDEPYKNEWCDQKLDLLDSYYGLTVNGKIHASFSQLQLGFKRKVKANKPAMAFLKAANIMRTKAKNQRNAGDMV